MLASSPAILRSFAKRTAVVSRQVSAMAAKTYDIVVKGKPDTNTLLDCPFCHRVLLTLQTKGVDYDMTYVDFANKPEWLIQASAGKVPVLRKAAENLVMPDSDVIVQYLEKEHPSPSMVSTVDPSVGAKLFPAFRQYLFSAAGSEEEKEKLAALHTELNLLNDALSKPGVGPLFGGSNMNATDAAVAPKLYHIQVALKHFKHFTIPETLAAVHKYLAAVKELPAWKATDYGQEAIIAGWTRHLAEHH